jgi:queuosine precursor transporter
VQYSRPPFREGSALCCRIPTSRLANIFVLKQISLFSLDVTCSDALMIGSCSALNLLRAFFGRKEAQKATVLSFCTLCLFAVLSQIHLLYVPSPQDNTQTSFIHLLAPSPRIFAASLLTYVLVQQIDLYLFQKMSLSSTPNLLSFELWKRAKGSKAHSAIPSLARRNAVCLLCSQAVDTVLFTFLGLYGVIAPITDMMLMSFLIKIIIIFSFTPFIALAKRVALPPTPLHNNP